MDLQWNPADFLQSLEENNAPSNDYKQKFERQRDANKNLKAMISSIRTSAQDSLAMYSIEKAEKEYLLKQQTALQNELAELKENYVYMENTSINRTHLQNQIYQEMKKEKVEDYMELGKDYLALWSQLTCYHNFEITKQVNRMILKTEKFIRKHEPGFKKAKIVKTIAKSGPSSYDYDTDSQVSTMSQKSSTKRASDKSRNLKSKKRKTDSWDQCSNSSVLSPERVESFDEIDHLDNVTNDSSYSTNVSISSTAACDESSFNLLQFNRKCYCTKKTTSDEKSVQTNIEEYAKLVSVGTNTEEEEVDNQDPLPSLPFLLDDDLLSDLAYSNTPATSPLEDDLVLEQALEYININTNKVVNNPMKNIKHTMDGCTNTEVAYPEVQTLPLLELFDSKKLGKSRKYEENLKLNIILSLGKTIATQTITENNAASVVEKSLPEYRVVGTNTDLYSVKEPCVMVNHATSTDVVIIEKAAKHTSTDSTCMSDASTITVHSSTTRGTSTTSIAMKNVAIQFPESSSCSIDKILSEMKFVMPLCISPIRDINVQKFNTTESQTISESKIIYKSFGTLTEINNVCRKVDYVITKDESRRIKKEVLSPAVSMGNLNVEQCPENRSFMVLGQTLFEIFLERLQMTRSHFMNEEISQQNWNEMKEKVMDEFLALTNEKDFPETGDSDIVSVEKSKEDQRLSDSGIYKELTIIETQIDDTVIINSSVEVEDMVHEPFKTLSEEEATTLKQEVVEVSSQIQGNIHNEILQENEIDMSTKPIVLSKEIQSPQPTQPTFKLPLTPKTSITNSKQRKRERKSIEKMLYNVKTLVNIPEIIEPIEELPDVIWSSLFPKTVTCEPYNESPRSPVNILEDFDFDYETVYVPPERTNQIIEETVCVKDEDMEVKCLLENLVKVYSDKETPQSPPPFIQKSLNPLHEPKIIPLEQEFSKNKIQSSMVDAVLKFNPQLRSQFVLKNKELNITDKCNEKRLCKIRKSLKIYLEAPWTNENLEECLMVVSNYTDMEELLTEAIWETIEDQKDYTEVNADFTTPAPALPQYLQRIILLISKLTEENSNLPKKLLDDLEEKVFKLDNSKMELIQLTNITYYYSALMDLFFDGDCSMIFHYIVKSIYYYGYKAIPMTHVLIKAFPSVLPKKSLILKKYLKDVDWDSVSLLEVSKMELDYEQLDSLDLTVMYMLTNFKLYNIKKHPSHEIREHELFKYLPKYYGFPLNFITAPKLLEILMKRLQNNQLQNLSFSFILLARRMNTLFVLRTMMKSQLIPLLSDYFEKFLVSKAHEQEIILLIEIISAILKPHSDEKDKSFVDIFSLIINILSRSANHSIEESCIKALLRLQRLNNNPKDIYNIIKQWNPLQEISKSLQLMIGTFVHRKNANFFQS
ncbi:unnamed protein product [Diamesa serratosioi]